MTSISLIKEAGEREIGYSRSNTGSYCELMAFERGKYPVLQKYIAPVVVQASGFGWGMELHSSYGLTFEGIRVILSMLKIKAKVADSLQELKDAIPKRDGRAAIITGSSLLAGLSDRGGSHAVSIFVRREKGVFLMTLNDGKGASRLAEEVQNSLFKKARVVAMPSKVKRQEDGEVTCNATAIMDCVAFGSNPRLIEDILELNWRKYIER
ncbi:MAG: hypothetical protein ACHQT8_07370 [Chlamydiales bacterium]